MFTIFNRLVNWWKLIAGFTLAALPVIAYMFGRKEGKKIEEVKQVKETVRVEKARTEFYKAMEQAAHEVQNNRPADRDDLVDRLRKHGL